MGTMSEESPPVEGFIGNEEKKDAEVLPGLVIRADGTVLRNTDRTRPTTMVAASPVFVNGVASKDLVFDSESGIWGRVFIPESLTGGLIEKLPIVVYFHGGGFCMGDAGNGLMCDYSLLSVLFPVLIGGSFGSLFELLINLTECWHRFLKSSVAVFCSLSFGAREYTCWISFLSYTFSMSQVVRVPLIRPLGCVRQPTSW